MKNEEYLDDLFDKARLEGGFVPPEDVLSNLKGKGPKSKYSKGLIKFIPLAVAAIICFFIFLVNGKDDTDVAKSTNNLTSAQKESQEKINLSGEIQTIDSLRNPLPETISSNIKGSQKEPEIRKNISNSGAWHASQGKQNKRQIRLKGEIDKLLALQSLKPEVFEIDSEKDTVLEMSNGSKFFIESQTFCNKLLKRVKGKIKFEAKSCFSPGDMMRENLSTGDGQILLQSAGMFHTKATYNNEELQIREGYEIGYNPGYEVAEEMELYEGKRDEEKNITWKKDPLGEIPSPVFIAVRGKYGAVFNDYFYKNYKLDKEFMLALQDTGWKAHFTSYFGKIHGNRSCNQDLGPFLSACEKFNRVLAPELVKREEVKAVSFMTEFEFRCMSKNQFAYAQEKGFIDSFRNYMAPTVLNKLKVPLFYPRSLGWGNMDCPPKMAKAINEYNKIPKTNIKVHIPNLLKANAFLYFPEQNSLDRSVNLNSSELNFYNVPDNQKAYLIVTSLYKDIFYVYKSEIEVSSQVCISLEFEKITDADDYLEWLKNAVPNRNPM